MRVLFLLLAISVYLAAGTDTAVRHVTVSDVVYGGELKDRTVRIQGNRIASVSPTQEAAA